MDVYSTAYRHQRMQTILFSKQSKQKKKQPHNLTSTTSAVSVHLAVSRSGLGPNSTWLDSTRSTLWSRTCFSNLADDEEAVVFACTSLVFCALSVHVNKTEKRRHAVWVK